MRRAALGCLLLLVAWALAMPAAAADPPWASWADLLNMLPDVDALNAARASRGRARVGFRIQRIEAATGQHVNFDRYEVRVSKMPSGTTADQLFLAVRTHLNDYFDHAASTFGPYTPEDGEDWMAAKVPLGAVFVFRIPNDWHIPFLHEEAGVVTSLSQDRRWVFTPATIGWACPGEHPVSGNREFGLEARGTGWVMYTRAADRVLASCVPGERTVFAGADRLWRSWQRKVAAYVNGHGGTALVLAPTTLRPTWDEVVKSGKFTRGSGS